MTLTSQQKADINRLRDNEMLTGNLTDAAARAVLAWGEDQIAAGTPYEAVVAGVKAANRSGAEDPALALSAATSMLASVDAPARQALAPDRAADGSGNDMEAGLPLPTSHEGPDDAAQA